MTTISTAAGSLAQDMLLAFRDQHLSDITVVAFNQTFHLHRLILLRSGYFRSLILGQGEWIEKTRQAVNIQFGDPYVTLESFQRIIHWLYGIDFHYSEGSAPINFRNLTKTAVTATGLGRGAALMRSASASQYPSSTNVESGRHGLGLQHAATSFDSHQATSNTHADKAPSNGRNDNIMRDPSDKVDELLISMYAAASYLNITALMDEICSDIAHRIREGRGLIHYMGYAWKLNNGKAWDIILAQCFYQFFWSTYRSSILQDMLVSPEMPLAGLVKCLVSESLWVPNEYERYQLVKTIMLRRLNLDTDKLMNWVYDYHDQDWFMVLKDLDDNGTWSYELSTDDFLNNLQDWESTSTEQYEDAMDTDHDWASTTKELRRRSSVASATSFYGIDRNATPTIASSSSEPTLALAQGTTSSSSSSQGSLIQKPPQDLANLEDIEETQEPEEEKIDKIENPTPITTSTSAPEKMTTPQSPILDSPISTPDMSVISISNETLPRHQVRDLLIMMYILHHSIHYTHMSFDHLHQILTDGLVLPARVKDAFWRQHLLRRIAVSTSSTLPYLTAPSPLHGRHHGADTHRERRTPRAPMISRSKMASASSRPSPSTSLCQPCNSHGLLPIRFSTSLYISRRDLMTDGKHFTSSTFYGGSWWSIQVGNNLNSKGIVGVFLSAAPVPRVVPNSRGTGAGGATLGGGSRSNLSFVGGGTSPGSILGGPPPRARGSENAGGDCSSVYSRQRELTCSYRIYMTSNVVEPPEYFAATAASRLDEIRGSDYNYDHQNTSNEFPSISRTGLGASSSSVPNSPEMFSGAFDSNTTGTRSQQHRIASEDEMICHDSFKLNEGWGYSKSNYLTRVARHIRDQPPRSNPSLYSHDPHGAPPPPRAPPQQQQQQHAPGQQQQPGHPGQNMPAFPQGHAHPHPQGNVTQQNAINNNNNINNMTQPPTTSSSGVNSLHPSLNEELEDDGLWIHFVVKVGWSDLKPEGETA
ncbi:hypothetical protein CPC16_009034 [Podila verticillata]|nr:hypothetical protein BGZ52_007303 [Haplosporangium bisporale]KAF9211895.1 hypothetical protein BGZ59_007473 [Podila verticillata]KAF9383186.1 hypothetical protein CPC16_009034 [Podila verticillata]KAI9234369.1 MAG: hypothetical protein BYD32DRAFT_423703 [Podila humilis]KFH68741.1 hypothetical protein MVEG_05548 [Podila verticillata NRRL 6337]